MKFGASLNVCVDFDGTLVEHRHPAIGPDVPGAFASCREMLGAGTKLILLTMRDGELLEAAIEHCRERGVEFFAHNENPHQNGWTTSRKVFGHFYIDDTAIGCPRLPGTRPGSRPMVDWPEVMHLLRAEPQPS